MTDTLSALCRGSVSTLVTTRIATYSRDMLTLPSFRAQSAAHRLTVAIIAASLLNGIFRQVVAASYLGDILLFVPAKVVLLFQIWRPFSALFVADTPAMIIFGALIVFSIGGILESRWGPRRLLRVTLGLPFLANALILPIALKLAPGIPFACAGSVVTTIWIVYGLRAEFAGEWISFWGTPLRGKTFALIGVGFPVLSGLLGDFRWVLPELTSACLAYGYMYKPGLFSPFSRFETLLQNFKRATRKKRGGLKVVPGKRFDDDDYSGHQIH
jgi:membrane associated rhomboid family serine protease